MISVDWWIWILGGIVLLSIDILLVNIYFLMWFGLSAVVTGCVAAAFEPSLPTTIILWTLLSLVFVVVWIKKIKPYYAARLMRQATTELPGNTGIVTRMNDNGGQIRLQTPIGGRVLWECHPVDFAIGDRVMVQSLDEQGMVCVKKPRE